MKIRTLIMGVRGSKQRDLYVCLCQVWYWHKVFWATLLNLDFPKGIKEIRKKGLSP